MDKDDFIEEESKEEEAIPLVTRDRLTLTHHAGSHDDEEYARRAVERQQNLN